MRAKLILVPALATALGLGACAYVRPNQQTRGTMVDPVDYKQITPGTSTRADVTSLLGSPPTRATFDDDTWIYVGMITEPVIMGFPRIKRQEVVVMNFNPNGTVRTIRRLTGKDAIPVAMAGGSTPSPGSEATILQQVIGNVGRYNPAGMLGGATGPGGLNGSAGGPGGQGLPLP